MIECYTMVVFPLKLVHGNATMPVETQNQSSEFTLKLQLLHSSSGFQASPYKSRTRSYTRAHIFHKP